MIRKNKVQVVLSSIVVLLPVIAGLIMWNALPDRMITHWGVDGQADGWSGKGFTVLVLPLTMFVAHWICILATARDPKNKEQSSKVFQMMLWMMPIVSLITCGMTYAVALGSTIRIDMGVRILLGLMFVVLGNYMPKFKQNHTIGVKVSWTLQNEENWNKTHRFTGRLWVLGGVLMLATIFVPMESIMWAFLVVILLLSFAPIIYSYVYHRKQLKAGTATKEKGKAGPMEKKMTILSLVISIPILVGVGVLLFTGDITVHFESASFSVESVYWDDMTVDYAAIDAVEYRKQDDPGTRAYGFGSFKLLMGNFENDEFGKYTRYSYIGCDSCVVIHVDDKVLVINGQDEANTKELYEELDKRIHK